MKDSIGIYIHIPFCLSKCPYCDFYSRKADGALLADYAEAVCRTVRLCGVNGRSVDSVYFGGGTPSLMDARLLSKIMREIGKAFSLDEPEVTLEANPSTAGADKLRSLRGIGFNRISFGVQSSVGAELAAIGRLHTAEDAARSVLAAKDAGFENISADLMLGIPYQTKESLRQSIDFLTRLPVTHVSAYMLKIEEGTAFAAAAERNMCPDEDSVSEMYLDCVETLESKGFSQYEISNFAKTGRESRHNLRYWRCNEYLGIGPSAHSFIDGKRFYMPRDLDAFIGAGNPIALTVQDGEGGGFEEYAMLRLRLREGLDLTEATEKFGVDTGRIEKKATALEKRGLLALKNNIVSLTAQGFLLSNAVTAELLLDY